MMDADELDRRARVATALIRGGEELVGALEVGDFYQRAAELGKGVLEGAQRALAERGGAEPALDVRPIGEVGPDWLTVRLPPRPALLTRAGKPWLVQGKVGLLLAPGGTGKTWALAQLAVAVATGGKWFDTYEATKGRVLLALGEEDAEEIRRRLFDVCKALGLSEYERAEVGRNLTAWGLAGKSVALLGKNAAGEPVPSEWFGRLKAALEAGGPWRAVLLDPWSRWGGPDVELDNHCATRGVELLEELTAAAGGATVLVAHHTRKGGKDEATSGADADASRGASALVDGARWVANLVRPKGDDGKRPLVLRVSKHNHTAPSEPLELVRGEDGALRPLTPAERAELAERDKPKPKSGKPKGNGSTGADRAAGADEGDDLDPG